MFRTETVQKIKIHFVSSNLLFENRAICEIMWDNIVDRGRPQIAIWRMRIASWIPKATDTHSEYVNIFINCNWVVTRWLWLFYMYLKYEIGY